MRYPEFDIMFKEASEETNIEKNLLAAISFQESQWDPRAKSSMGVRGMMMVTLETAALVGVEKRLNPEQNIKGGAKYFAMLYEKNKIGPISFFFLNRKKLDHFIFDADLFLHEVKYFLTKELSVEYIKEKIHDKIYYVKEKLADLKKNFMCLKSRLRMYAWQQKKKKYKPYNHYGKREIINR